MIVEKWGVKDNCVGCGLPCMGKHCRHHDAGATVECDECGTQWDVALDSPELDEDCGDYHLCKVCREIGEWNKARAKA